MDTYLFSSNSEMRYAQTIELDNGRWAMMVSFVRKHIHQGSFSVLMGLGL